MSRVVCRIAIALVALAALGACPGSSTPPGADAGAQLPAELTADEFDTALDGYFDAYCAFKQRCGMLDSAQVAACKASFHWSIANVSVRKGYVVALRAPMEGCLAKLEDLQCSAAVAKNADDPCGFLSFFSANTNKGGACLVDIDCKDKKYCARKGCTGYCSDSWGPQKPGESCAWYSCDGTLGDCDWAGTTLCKAWASSGQSCTATSCTPKTLYCNGATQLCAAYVVLGQPCRSTDANGGCGSNAYCKTSSGTYGTCEARLVENAPCTGPINECGTYHTDAGDRDLYCDTTQNKCLRKYVATGERCYTVQTCEEYGVYCKDGTATIQGTCSLPTFVKLSETCDATAPFNKVCDLGLWCDSISSKCKALSGEGGACLAGLGCKAFLDCVGTTCALPQVVGKSCAAAGTTCAAPTYCDYTTKQCMAPRGIGANCSWGDECTSRNCSDGKCIAACQ
jgi:hypothetical protein